MNSRYSSQFQSSGARRWALSAASIALLSSMCGCERAWRNGFIDPTQVGRFESKPVRNEIRRTLGPMDEPAGIPGASEPTRDDLIVTYEETPIDRGDVVDISVFELVTPGAPTDVRRIVNEVGYVTLPTIGAVKVLGMTPRQLERHLMDYLRHEKILVNPEVTVLVAQSQAKRFSVIGNTNRVGEYPIPRPDYRLLEVIASIGPLSPFQRRLYVLRGGQPQGRTPPGAERFYEDAVAGTTTSTGPARPVERDPFAEGDGYAMAHLSDDGVGGPTSSVGSGFLGGEPAASRRNAPPAANPSPPVLELQPLLPGESLPAGSSAPRPGSMTSGGESMRQSASEPTHQDFLQLLDDRRSQPNEDLNNASQRAAPKGKWVYVNNEWVEVADDTTRPPPEATVGAAPQAPTTSRADGVDWEALSSGETPLRVIEIPVDALSKGDMRYNIVLRPSDIINVPAESTGEYYVTGNVARPGAYALNGRDTTVKEAIAAAGGFGLLAWPSRAELVRRLPGDQEEIRSINLDRIIGGDEPDFFLQPNDIINVGTNAVAPFLATLRNSFRLSYGFGFVYDRNYADEDSFFAKESVRRDNEVRRLRRGLTF